MAINPRMGWQLENSGNCQAAIEKSSCECNSNLEGYWTKERASFEFEPEVIGQTLFGSISLDGTVMNPGQDVEITVDHHGSCQRHSRQFCQFIFHALFPPLIDCDAIISNFRSRNHSFSDINCSFSVLCVHIMFIFFSHSSGSIAATVYVLWSRTRSSRTHVRLGAWFWSAKADIFFSESLHILHFVPVGTKPLSTGQCVPSRSVYLSRRLNSH